MNRSSSPVIICLGDLEKNNCKNKNKFLVTTSALIPSSIIITDGMEFVPHASNYVKHINNLDSYSTNIYKNKLYFLLNMVNSIS